MRKETKVINIYKFEELKEDVKQRLIERKIEDQYEIYCENFLYTDMEEKAQELLKKYFKNNSGEIKNVYYDLDYSQGSGAMFEFDLFYYNKHVSVKQYGHYYHARSFILDSYELTDQQEKQLKEKIIRMFEELEEYGYSLVDYRITEDEAMDILNEYEYLEDGQIYNE